MKYAFIALSLALAIGPATALADNAPPPPPQLTQQQRTQLHQTFETFRTQEEQLHRQYRSQVLNSLSPARRQTLAGIIGQLAISPNPDPRTAARQIDTLLSQGEQQRILSLHNSYRSQERTLHEQMFKQLQSEMPAGFPMHGHDNHPGGPDHPNMQPRTLDAGMVLLMSLAPKMEMEHHGMWPGGPGGH